MSFYPRPRCEKHQQPLLYVAYPDEQMVGEFVCLLCEDEAPEDYAWTYPWEADA